MEILTGASMHNDKTCEYFGLDIFGAKEDFILSGFINNVKMHTLIVANNNVVIMSNFYEIPFNFAYF